MPLRWSCSTPSAAAAQNAAADANTAVIPGAGVAAAAGRRTIPQDGLNLEDFVGGRPEEPSDSDEPEPDTGKISRAEKLRLRRLANRKPSWLKAEPPAGENYLRLKGTVKELGLATVCEEARCPNIGECWGGKEGTATATIMIMGDTCTRGCKFCAVATSPAPPPLDPEEPRKVSEAIHRWGLNYVVLTSVDRDDLPDFGASHFAETVRRLKTPPSAFQAEVPLVEALTPDWSGRLEFVDLVVDAGLDVYAHNVETVEALQHVMRDRRAGYAQSLAVLARAKEGMTRDGRRGLTKTSLMMGCGETDDQVRTTLRDLRDAGVDVVTFGQYLRPTKRHAKVREYVTPEKFAMWQTEAESMGFLYVASGPLVRSSYRAGEFFLENYFRRHGETHQQHQIQQQQ